MDSKSYNLLSLYLREKYHKSLTRFEKALSSGRFATYSKQKKTQILARLNRYAKQLGIALKPGLITACLSVGICFATPASAQTFAEQTGISNPLNGVNVADTSTPAFVDIDGDGDHDVFIGEYAGIINYYKNTGTTTSPVFIIQTGTNNPFNGVDIGIFSTPTFEDIDRDGDQDVFVGDLYGAIVYYKNTGTTTSPVFVLQTGANNPFDGVSLGYRSKPHFVDIDADGDKDAFIGNNNGVIKYYKNTGTTTNPIFVVQTGANNPLNAVSLGETSITFVDIDRDGDQDAFIGEGYGSIHYYTNTGTTTAPVFIEKTGANNPFDGVDVGDSSLPTFVDIDTDGDKDFFIGSYAGDIRYFPNTATPTPLGFVEQLGTTNPFDGIDVGIYSAPTFEDIDADGDFDIFVGAIGIKHYKNTGTTQAPVFVEQTGAANPFNGMYPGTEPVPTFVDIDADGDKDAFVGEYYGSIVYYKNTGTATSPIFVQQVGAANPLNNMPQGVYYSAPTFEDIDGDGDQDAIVGCHSSVKYYQNIGTTTAPVFVEQIGSTNPWQGIHWTPSDTPVLVDIDRDGDKDFFLGINNGTIKYYQNTGTNTNPVFVLQTGNGNPLNGLDVGSNAKPIFRDIDGDGDQDLLIGEFDGTINYYKNTPPPCNTPVFDLASSSTRCKGAETISYNATNTVSYSLSSAGTSTINTATGQVIWDANFTGSATITAIGIGCNATHTVTINPLAPTPTIVTSSNANICVGNSVTLTGSGTGASATEYAWFRNGTFVKYSNTSADYTFQALAGTNTYKLVVIYSGGCPSSQSTGITLTGVAPVAVITPSSNPPYCTNALPILNATPPTGTGYTYSWIGSSPTAATTTTSTFTPTNSGNHRVIVTDASGCSKPSPWLSIAINPIPPVYSGANQSVCVNSTITIGAKSTPGLTYSWTPSTYLSSATISNPNVSPTVVGPINYTLTVTKTSTGCANTGTVSVNVVNPSATPNLSRTSSPVCQGSSITLTPSGIVGTVNWYRNGVFVSTATTSTPKICTAPTATPEFYTVRAHNGICLSAPSNAVDVMINAALRPQITSIPASLNGLVSICNGTTNGTAELQVSLPSSAPVSSYNWKKVVLGGAINLSPAVTTSNLNVWVTNTAPSYNNLVFLVEVTYANGCTKQSTNVLVAMQSTNCATKGEDIPNYTENDILSVYPNPTAGLLHLNVENCTALEGQWTLSNALGQVLLSRTVFLKDKKSEEMIDISDIVSGVYILTFQTRDAKKVLKIVKD